MKKLPKIILITFIINFSLAAAQLYFTIARAADGDQLAKLSLQQNSLRFQAQQTTSEIFRLSSLSYIQSQATKLNLGPTLPWFVSPNPLAAAFRSP